MNLDEELIPIRCPAPRCGAEFQETVRRLKSANELRRYACGTLIKYDPDELARRVQDLEQSVDDALRNLVSLKVGQQLP
jgi:DNA-directed RNA polymerase subunit N (RpoN/RPB10)